MAFPHGLAFLALLTFACIASAQDRPVPPPDSPKQEGDESRSSRPEAVVREFLEIMKRKGNAGIEESLQYFTKKAREAWRRFQEFADQEEEESKVQEYKILDSKESVGEALVTATITSIDGGKTRTDESIFTLKKEDGHWRIFKVITEGLTLNLEELMTTGSKGKQPRDMETKAWIEEMVKVIESYKAEHGEYPPSSLEGEADPKKDRNETNRGIELLFAALRGQAGKNAGEGISKKRCVDTDGDAGVRADKRPRLYEIGDAWGNPLIYIHHRDYGKTFTYKDSEGTTFTVEGRKNPETGAFYHPEGFQLWSVGEDLTNQREGGDDIGNCGEPFTVFTFKGDPKGRALYDKMLDALQKAETLSFTLVQTAEMEGMRLPFGPCSVWLKKPNFFRLEVEGDEEGKPGGIIIGDGQTMWTVWPGKRPRWGEDEKTYAKTCLKRYMQEPAPPGMHSIGHRMMRIGAWMPALNPSRFHGAPSSLDDYFDGVRFIGTKTVEGEVRDGIEVSFMKHQRSRYLWLSRKDHLPRSLKEVVRVNRDIVDIERWENVSVGVAMPDILFHWKPPEGWKEWREPDMEREIVKPGTQLPDFALEGIDGKKIKLSDFKGKVVWIYVWCVG
ncbi:MAG: hypothetical protein ACYTHN_19170 [Planctomycetota bacterium]